MPGAAKWVPMVDSATGKTVEVHPADARSALESEQYTVETPEQAKLREYQKTAGIAEGVKSFSEHAAGSASFGLTDAILSDNPEYRANRQLRDQTYGAAPIAGDAFGYIAPGLGEAKLVGTAGKIAKGIAAPVSAVSRVAGGAGRIAEVLVAKEGAGALRKIAGKAIGGVVSGGLEGAAMGAGAALSEASMQDKELTAELLLSHARDGALIGGTMGGALGGGIEALSLGAKGLKSSGVAKSIPGIGDALGAAEGAGGLSGLAETKALTSFGALGSDIKRIVKEGGSEAPNRIGRRIIDEAGFAGEGAFGRAIKHDLNSAAELATEKVGHYTQQLRDVYKGLDAAGDKLEAATLLRSIDEQVLAPLRGSKYGGDAKIAAAIESEIRPISEAVAKAEAVKTSSEALRSFDSKLGQFKESLGANPLSREMFSGINQELNALKNQLRTAGLDDVAKGLESAANDLRSAFSTPAKGTGIARQEARFYAARKTLGRVAGEAEEKAATAAVPSLSYDEVWKLRQRVDMDVKNWAVTSDPRVGAYRDLRGVLKSEIERQAEKTGLASEFKAANSGVSDWIKVEKIAKERAGMAAGNRTIGLTDTIAGTVGGSAGAILGGGIGAAAGGLVFGTANKLMRSSAGDRLFSTLANKASNWRNVVQASDRAAIDLSRQVQRSISTEPIERSAAGISSKEAIEYDTQRKRLIERQGDQGRLLTELTDQLQGVSEVAPELTMATVAAGSRGLAYLRANLPQVPGYPDLQSEATKDKLDVPDSQRAEWLRLAKSIMRPASILTESKDGTLTPQQVEGVKATTPALYSAMQAQALERLTDDAARGRIPSYEDRLRLSTLTGVPLDSTLNPDVMKAYKNVYASFSAQPQQNGSPMPNSGRKTNFASRRESLDDRNT